MGSIAVAARRTASKPGRGKCPDFQLIRAVGTPSAMTLQEEVSEQARLIPKLHRANTGTWDLPKGEGRPGQLREALSPGSLAVKHCDRYRCPSPEHGIVSAYIRPRYTSG